MWNPLDVLRRGHEADHSDGPGGTLHVERKGSQRLLVSEDGIVQSAVDLDDPGRPVLAYVRVMLGALGFATAPRRVLIIGLGGGALPRALRSLVPDLEIDLVDVDEAVVGLARAHFELIGDGKLRVHVADGRAFLEQASGKWDLIFLDAFVGQQIPAHLTTREFLVTVGHHLAPDGVVASNVFGPNGNHHYVAMLRTHHLAFGSVVVLAAGRANRILVCGGGVETHTKEQALETLALLPTAGLLPSDTWDSLGAAQHLDASAHLDGEPIHDPAVI